MSDLATSAVKQGHLPTSGMPHDVPQIFKYFGPPQGMPLQTAYDNFAYTNFDAREAYRGRNLFMAETITGFILEQNDWYTTIALPWMYTDQLHIKFNEWKFNHVLAGRVPHEGISRLISTSKRQFADHQVRRGLAFMIEADFLNTDEGRMQYFRNITGIAQAVQETQNHDTIHALLMANRSRQQWEQKFGKLPISYERILKEEVINYGIITESQYGLEIAYENGKRILQQKGVAPDLIIMSPGSKIYLTMAQPTKTQYYAMGPDGVLIQKEGPDAMQIFRESVAFETRPFDIDVDTEPIQLLTRQVQIGEYYEMTIKEHKHSSMHGYQTKWRDLWVYDENKDNW